MPDVLSRPAAGACEGHQIDALELCAARSADADIVYLDPPYNQHSYLGNYHVWESLVRWDRPEVYGVAMKRTEVRERWSPFNRRGTIAAALREVVARVRARWLVVSFSDEGYLAPAAVRALLAERGRVRVARIPHRRYIGAAIGIYNPRGEKVGTPGPRTNRECLFVVEVAEDAAALAR
jgi:adenine-specific DNA-methyltransferase